MRIQKRNNSYTPLRFSEVGLSAQYLARIIETRLKDLTNILLKYESHEVVLDEVARTLDLLKHLKENRKYFRLRVGAITTFLPRNQPLYAFACFVVVPSLMASEVHFRIPHSMRNFFPGMLKLLEISRLFPNVVVSFSERLDFLKARSALLIDPQTKESKPITDVVIFTGIPTHADRLRLVFDRRTLFIVNGAGHNPVVISKDANLSKAVEAVLTLQLYNQGQDCAAPNAILVHKSVAIEFLCMLRENIRDIKVGHYADRSCRTGPISDPNDLVRIQNFLINNREWIDPSTTGIIRTRDSIVEPTIIYKPIIKGGNFSEIFAPIMFVQEYANDKELRLYFENKNYARNAMYVTLYGTSAYIQNLINRPILGKKILDRSTFIHNTHLHAPGVERGTLPYGGYGYGASSLSINGKITALPTLPQRDIYKWIVQPLLKKKAVKSYNKKAQRFTEIQEKNVERLLKLQSLTTNPQLQIGKITNDTYLDSYLIKKHGLRYVKIDEKDVYHLLKKSNVEYINSLNRADIKLIHDLRKLLKRKSVISADKFSSLLYSIPKELNETKASNITRQRLFFQHVYQLLFGRKSGPRLALFLLDAEEKTVARLLDV